MTNVIYIVYVALSPYLHRLFEYATNGKWNNQKLWQISKYTILHEYIWKIFQMRKSHAISIQFLPFPCVVLLLFIHWYIVGYVHKLPTHPLAPPPLSDAFLKLHPHCPGFTPYNIPPHLILFPFRFTGRSTPILCDYFGKKKLDCA